MENNAYYITKRAKNEQIFTNVVKMAYQETFYSFFDPNQICRAYITHWLVMTLICNNINDTN